MSAEECLEIAKCHMAAEEIAGRMGRAIGAMQIYCTIRDRIWSEKTIDEKVAFWRERGVSEEIISDAVRCGLNG